MTFHVPEQHRVTFEKAEQLGLLQMGSDETDGNNGLFILRMPAKTWFYFVIASDGSTADAQGTGDSQRWEHVSVSLKTSRGREVKCIPTWKDMCRVKDLFWDAEDVVVQYHPAKKDYVNYHPRTLHLWRPVGIELPTPDPIMVGPQPAEMT